MVEVFEKNLRETGRRSSKGNQLKWEADGMWYKADYLGYEGLAECVVSQLLNFSSLEKDEYVLYEQEEIKYGAQTYRGCKSANFTDGWQPITLERLFKNQYGEGLNKGIYSISDHEERLRFIVDQVERTTNIKGFGPYMCKLLTIDALFLNEDRHTHNISVLMSKGGDDYKLCPIYDNGGALLSDMMMDFPLGEDVYDQIDRVRAKTFCDSFDEQLDIAEKLYGSQISFSFSQKDIRKILENQKGYPKEITDRVEKILLWQFRKYSYLFKAT